MSFQWTVTPTQAFVPMTQAYIARIHLGLYRLAQSYAPRIEAWMKANAPWQDITGNLRQALFSDVIEIVNSAVIVILSHGLDYGVFLEMSRGGIWGIIGPALDHFIPLIWQDVQRMLR
jgi:hypothetical protein